MNKEGSSICFIILWYGKLPSYFNQFKYSLDGQPFDLLFITNQPLPGYLPKNVIWQIIEWDALLLHFEKTLQTKLKIESAYKLCDFKPAFGFLFSDYLKEYEFWGCLDTDLVMGDFEKIINKDFLDQFDFISGLEAYVTGSFFLLRNTAANNLIFQKSRSWPEVCSRLDMVSFTECNKHWNELQAGKDLFELKTSIQSFTELLLIEQQNGLRCRFSDLILEPKGFNPVKVIFGGVFYNEKSYLLAHFVYIKNRPWFYGNLYNYKAPYYINFLGTFPKKPSLFNLLLFRNFWVALYKKMLLQINKIIPN
jgi:hypothetical protein